MILPQKCKSGVSGGGGYAPLDQTLLSINSNIQLIVLLVIFPLNLVLSCKIACLMVRLLFAGIFNATNRYCKLLSILLLLDNVVGLLLLPFHTHTSLLSQFTAYVFFFLKKTPYPNSYHIEVSLVLCETLQNALLRSQNCRLDVCCVKLMHCSKIDHF